MERDTETEYAEEYEAMQRENMLNAVTSRHNQNMIEQAEFALWEALTHIGRARGYILNTTGNNIPTELEFDDMLNAAKTAIISAKTKLP